MTKKPIAYKLQPVYEPEPGSLATAAVITCMASGAYLSGCGGGGRFISSEIFDALQRNGRGRVILDADLFDRMKAALEAARDARPGWPVLVAEALAE